MLPSEGRCQSPRDVPSACCSGSRCRESEKLTKSGRRQPKPFSTTGQAQARDFNRVLLTASFTEQWVSGKDRIPALTGLLCSAFCLLVFGADSFLIPDMLLITAVLTLLRGKLSGAGKEDGR